VGGPFVVRVVCCGLGFLAFGICILNRVEIRGGVGLGMLVQIRWVLVWGVGLLDFGVWRLGAITICGWAIDKRKDRALRLVLCAGSYRYPTVPEFGFMD
jgi:hypothetical protein